MAAVLDGEAAKDAAELLALGQRAYDTRRYALAARFFDEAMQRDATIAENRETQPAYNAACGAALAGSGQGLDNPPPNDMDKATLRGQALTWLHAELDRWTRFLESATPEQRQLIATILAHWQNDGDLSGVRGDAIETLPESEREAWRALWTSVEAVRARAADKPTEPQP
jgi:hypothetical protein